MQPKAKDTTTEKSDALREKELFRAIGSTPHGQELIKIWERRLTRVKSFAPEMPEAQCRYVAGRQSIYIDVIRANTEN